MKKAINNLGLSVITLICIATFTPVSAQTEQPPFTRNDAMIPMRDGVRLNTRIYAPARTDERVNQGAKGFARQFAQYARTRTA